jgi:uncharacterized membrane protein YdjX (TVP38/TMEM64 family)
MDDRDRRARRAALVRIAGFAGALAIAFGIASATGTIPSAHRIRAWGEGLGPLGPALFVPLFVALNFVVAWPILAGAAGVVFGTAVGTPVSIAGVTLAAIAQMAVARYLAGDAVGRLLPERVARFEEFLERRGMVAVLYSRIVPALPWGAVNYGAGLTRVRFRDLGVGSLLGSPPKVFAYVALGGSLTNLGSTEAKVAVAVLIAIAIVGLVLARRQVRGPRPRPSD